MNISKHPFGELWGRKASLYTLENDSGMSLRISDYGGIITHWFVPDRNGQQQDIVLGFDHFTDYLAGHPFFGSLIGRFANRINAGQFQLNGKTYQLAAQANGNHLHGGIRGFDKYIWESHCEELPNCLRLVLQHHSPNGDEGYPGNLNVKVSYSLHSNNRLVIDYHASTDQPSIVNLTNHSYFNLTGSPAKGIDTHSIQIFAERFVEVDQRQIPTGNLPQVSDSYLDCRSSQNMGEMFAKAPNRIIDHCYVLQNQPGKLHNSTIVEEPSTGIRMCLHTDNVGLQFYNGNKLGALHKTGKADVLYPNFAGFCLETQCLPDSPNHANFPSCMLLPAENYRHRAEFSFQTF